MEVTIMKIVNDSKMLVAAGAAVVALCAGTVGVNADTVRDAVNNGDTPDTASNRAASLNANTTDPSTNTDWYKSAINCSVTSKITSSNCFICRIGC